MMTIKNNEIELERTTDAFNYWFEGKIPDSDPFLDKKRPFTILFSGLILSIWAQAPEGTAAEGRDRHRA